MEHRSGSRRAAKALRDQLQIEELFGSTPPITPVAPMPPLSARPEDRPTGPGAVPHQSGPHQSGPRLSVPLPTSPGGPPPTSAAPPEPDREPPVPHAEREARLVPVREEVAACTLCPLCQSRTNTVFGVGDPGARLMFVGEGPGFDEDRQGEPFVGRAGQLLNDIIGAMKLRREDVYIANIVKCRPPENRNPEPGEVESCLPYLFRQIDIVSPRVICALGGVAAKSLLATQDSVGRLRGRFHDVRGIPLRVTYHPAYLLRSPADKGKTWADVQEVMKILGIH